MCVRERERESARAPFQPTPSRNSSATSACTVPLRLSTQRNTREREDPRLQEAHVRQPEPNHPISCNSRARALDLSTQTTMGNVPGINCWIVCPVTRQKWSRHARISGQDAIRSLLSGHSHWFLNAWCWQVLELQLEAARRRHEGGQPPNPTPQTLKPKPKT